MNEKFPKVPTFKEELKRSKYDFFTLNIAGKPETLTKDKLFEFTNNDKYIVRKVPEHCLDVDSPNVINDAGTAQNLYSELKAKYAIEAPVQFVVAKDEANNKNSIFALTEHIKEVDYKTDEKEHSRAKESYEKLWESLVSYYEAKIEGNEQFLIDLSDVRQFVYGKKNDETEARWYLIDTDPMFSRDMNALYEDVDTLLAELDEIGDICGKSLHGLRKRCQALLKKLETPNDIKK